jgi:hypothetical protein
VLIFEFHLFRYLIELCLTIYSFFSYLHFQLAFHLSQLEKLLLPTQTTKMCLWTLQQDKSFYESNKSPLFNMLSKELGLTQEQSDNIQARRYAGYFCEARYYILLLLLLWAEYASRYWHLYYINHEIIILLCYAQRMNKCHIFSWP